MLVGIINSPYAPAWHQHTPIEQHAPLSRAIYNTTPFFGRIDMIEQQQSLYELQPSQLYHWIAHLLKLLRDQYFLIFAGYYPLPKMPLIIDAEQNIENEESPLLREEHNDETESCDQLDYRERKSNHFRTAAWTIIFVGIAVLFVKGWRDGGKDVNVSF